MTDLTNKVVASYFGDDVEYLVIFDTPDDYDKAEELREDFLETCDKEVDEGLADRFSWVTLLEYWTLCGVMYTEVTVDNTHDLYGR